jgi:hypothetical protein
MFKKLFTVSVLGAATAMTLLVTGCSSAPNNGVNGLTGTPSQEVRPNMPHFKGQYPSAGASSSQN